jgi:hypothetical protein
MARLLKEDGGGLLLETGGALLLDGVIEPAALAGTVTLTITASGALLEPPGSLGPASAAVAFTASGTLGTAPQLLGHWVAADALGAGTTLPDRSASLAHGTLTGGCTWGTVAGEPALRCPASDYASVPDHARWTLGSTFTLVVRLAFHVTSGQPGWLSHSQGSGYTTKWAAEYNFMSAGKTNLYWYNAAVGERSPAGAAWTPTVDTPVSLAIRRNGDAWDFARDGALDGSATASGAFADASAPLRIGWGGEAYFDSDVSIITLRIYGNALTDAELFAAMLEDAGGGTGSDALAGAATVAFSATGTFQGAPSAALAGAAILAFDGVGTLVPPVPALAGTAALALTAAATLGTPTAHLAARAAVRYTAAAALTVGAGAAFPPVRDQRIQRPVGRVERV